MDLFDNVQDPIAAIKQQPLANRSPPHTADKETRKCQRCDTAIDAVTAEDPGAMVPAG